MSHFACIGLSIRDGSELEALLQRLHDQMVLEVQQGPVQHFLWTDASGASLGVHLKRGKVVCLTPFFAPGDGLCRWTVSSSAPHDDDECAHCGGAELNIFHDGEMVTRATVQWLHYQPYRSWLRSSRSYELEVVAFGRQIRVFPDEAAFAEDKDTDAGKLKLAPDVFLPIGMFGPAATIGHAATAMMVGKVIRAEALENTRGGRFWRVRLETYPGCADVVLAAETLGEAPVPGAIARVDEAWVVGRPVEPVPKPSWIRQVWDKLGAGNG